MPDFGEKLDKVVEAVNSLQVQQASLTVTVGNLVEQVKKQNGSVTRLSEKVHVLEGEVSLHPSACVLREKFDKLHTRVNIQLGDTTNPKTVIRRIEELETETDNMNNSYQREDNKKRDLKTRLMYPVAQWGIITALVLTALLIFQHIDTVLTAIGVK